MGIKLVRGEGHIYAGPGAIPQPSRQVTLNPEIGHLCNWLASPEVQVRNPRHLLSLEQTSYSLLWDLKRLR